MMTMKMKDDRQLARREETIDIVSFFSSRNLIARPIYAHNSISRLHQINKHFRHMQRYIIWKTRRGGIDFHITNNTMQIY